MAGSHEDELQSGSERLGFSAKLPAFSTTPAMVGRAFRIHGYCIECLRIFGRGSSARKPAIEGDVHFLAMPDESKPPKVFNAAMLRAQLEPIINGEKCGGGNVCPHVHDYLLPKGKLW